MSIEYCHYCHYHVDTDYDAEHFEVEDDEYCCTVEEQEKEE